MKQMTPKEKGQFLIKYFQNERGGLDLNDVDLSDFKGNVDISGWKVGGNLFQGYQEVGGNLYQENQKVECSLYQDEQKTKEECKYVEPNYKAEYERLRKELNDANMQKEALLWFLAKIKEASK